MTRCNAPSSEEYLAVEGLEGRLETQARAHVLENGRRRLLVAKVRMRNDFFVSLNKKRVSEIGRMKAVFAVMNGHGTKDSLVLPALQN